MKRSVSLISVGITAFSIVVLASVVYGVRASASTRTEMPEPVTAMPVALEVGLSPELTDASGFASPRISPQAAITLASEFLGRTDAYSIQLTDYKGQPAFKVVFSSGDVVFVSVGGEVLDAIPAPVQMASLNSDRDDWESHGGNNSDGDDHEEHEAEHESESEPEAGD